MRREKQKFQYYRFLKFIYLIKYLLHLKYLEELSDIKENPPSELPPILVTTATIDNELLYHGRRYDTESNLYYYRARYYDPIMGRFLSTDPMGYKDSKNLYQAFNMNGYNFVDPMGLTTIMINISRTSINSKSITGEYSITLKDLWVDMKDFVKNFSKGYKIFQDSKTIKGVTLELPWNSNKSFVSSIPLGKYEVKFEESDIAKQLGETELLELKNVPNRTLIRIHHGNFPDAGTGCLLFGVSYNSEKENWIEGPTKDQVVKLMDFVRKVMKYDKDRKVKTKVFAEVNIDIDKVLINYARKYFKGNRNLRFEKFVNSLRGMIVNSKENLEFKEKALKYFLSISSKLDNLN